jgi:hypothetical protein
MATYQGADYLPQQIDSICRQTVLDWTLLIRDDGSSDATLEILRRQAALDSRLVVLEDRGPRLGAAMSFARLAEEAYHRGAEYLFFADQDDFWHPDKLDRQLTRMRETEQSCDGRAPSMVYSDLEVCDAELKSIHRSFLRYACHGHGSPYPLRTLLARNFVPGCACLVNRPLLDFALPVPSTAVMHDWWLTLSAVSIGRIAWLSEPLGRYRQHGRNASGSAGFWAGLNPLFHPWRRRWQQSTAHFRQSVEQVRSLRDRLIERRPQMDRRTLELLDRYLQVFDRTSPGPRRLWRLWRLGLPELRAPRLLLFCLCVFVVRTAQDPTICRERA